MLKSEEKIQDMQLPWKPDTAYELEGLSDRELKQVFRNADEISRSYRPSLIYDSNPVIKVRKESSEDVERRIAVGEKLGAPATEILQQEITDRTVIAQERLEIEEPDEKKLRDAARYIDQALEQDTVPISGLDDYIYRDGLLLYVDITDKDSFTPPTHRNIEGSLNGLAVSASANTDLNHEEALQKIDEEIKDTRASEVLKSIT